MFDVMIPAVVTNPDYRLNSPKGTPHPPDTDDDDA